MLFCLNNLAVALDDMNSGVPFLVAQAPVKVNNKRFKEWRDQDFRRYFKQLGSKDKYTRSKAVKTIINDYKDFVPKNIAPLLGSENSIERHSALKIVRKYPDERYKSDLLNIIKNDKQKTIRKAAMETIKDYNTPDVGNALIDLYGKQSDEEKEMIVEILGSNRFEPALPLIEKALEEEQWFIRRSAVLALSGFKQRKHIDIFIRMFNDENNHVRYMVLKAIQKYNIPSNQKLVDLLNRASKDKDLKVSQLGLKMLKFDGMH